MRCVRVTVPKLNVILRENVLVAEEKKDMVVGQTIWDTSFSVEMLRFASLLKWKLF